jgi:hypothetical protein
MWLYVALFPTEGEPGSTSTLRRTKCCGQGSARTKTPPPAAPTSLRHLAEQSLAAHNQYVRAPEPLHMRALNRTSDERKCTCAQFNDAGSESALKANLQLTDSPSGAP